MPLLFPYTVLNKNCNAAAEEIKIAMVQGNVSIGISNPLTQYQVLNKNCNAAAEEIKIAMVQGNVSIGISNPEYKLDVTAAEAE